MGRERRQIYPGDIPDGVPARKGARPGLRRPAAADRFPRRNINRTSSAPTAPVKAPNTAPAPAETTSPLPGHEPPGGEEDGRVPDHLFHRLGQGRGDHVLMSLKISPDGRHQRHHQQGEGDGPDRQGEPLPVPHPPGDPGGPGEQEKKKEKAGQSERNRRNDENPAGLPPHPLRPAVPTPIWKWPGENRRWPGSAACCTGGILADIRTSLRCR